MVTKSQKTKQSPELKRVLTLLSEANNLKARGADALFDRVKIYIALFTDMTYREHINRFDDFEVADILSREVDDTPWTFLELKAIYDRYPMKEVWIERGTRSLANDVQAAHDMAKPKGERKPRKTATLAEVEELKKEVKRLKAENRKLRKENAELKQQCEMVPA